MIRPLGIAEVGPAAGEGVRAHGSPDGVAQVRGGLHHDNFVAGPTDVESKLIRPYAEVGIAGARLRQPLGSRTTGERSAPARGARQIIDGCLVCTSEHRRINAGGVTLEIDSR